VTTFSVAESHLNNCMTGFLFNHKTTQIYHLQIWKDRSSFEPPDTKHVGWLRHTWSLHWH